MKNPDFIPGTMEHHGDIKQGWWIFVAVLAAQFLTVLPSWNSLFCMLLMQEYASMEEEGPGLFSVPSSQGTSSDPAWADWTLPQRS